jgi:hypothetical protein
MCHGAEETADPEQASSGFGIGRRRRILAAEFRSETEAAMQHEMPKPGPEHVKLAEALSGRWVGEETLSPSPWGPGGPAVGRAEIRVSLDGFFLLQDYREEKDGAVVYRGHGVFGFDRQSGQYVWWWFDVMGHVAPAPSRGTWKGDVLTFLSESPMGRGRYTYRFRADGSYELSIENQFPGKDDWTPFMRGTYRREWPADRNVSGE